MKPEFITVISANYCKVQQSAFVKEKKYPSLADTQERKGNIMIAFAAKLYFADPIFFKCPPPPSYVL